MVSRRPAGSPMLDPVTTTTTAVTTPLTTTMIMITTTTTTITTMKMARSDCGSFRKNWQRSRILSSRDSITTTSTTTVMNMMSMMLNYPQEVNVSIIGCKSYVDLVL